MEGGNFLHVVGVVKLVDGSGRLPVDADARDFSGVAENHVSGDLKVRGGRISRACRFCRLLATGYRLRIAIRSGPIGWSGHDSRDEIQKEGEQE